MFGTANQLLATIALAIGTSYLINRGKVRYAWITIVPMIFVGITTLIAGISNMKNIYYPQMLSEKMMLQGIINLSLTGLIIVSLFIIVFNAIPGWISGYRGKLEIIQD
jgi:carbon starvation protein